MPIPIANKQNQFRAPKVAQGQAVDASQSIAKAYEPALNTIKQINEAGNSVLKFAITEHRANETYKAQNALNEYIVAMDNLDREFQQYTYEEAQKQLPNYYNKSDELHKKFITSIDNLDVSDIREQFRQQVNSFNIRQRNAINSFVYKQKKLAETETYKNSQIIQSDMASRAVNPYGNGEDNFVTFMSAIQQGLANEEQYGATNYIPREAIDVSKQQFIGKTFEKAVANMANGIDFNLPGNSYQNVLEFITAMRGEVPEDVWQQVSNKYENESLNLAYSKDPDSFRVSDNINEFDDEKAAIFAPHLSKDQRRKQLKEIANGVSNNGDINKGVASAELKKKLLSSSWQSLYESGYGNKDNWFIDRSWLNANNDSSEDWKKQPKSFSELKNARETLQNILDGGFWYKGNTIIPIKNSTGVEKMQGFDFINIAPENDTERGNIEDTIIAIDNILKARADNGELDDYVYTSKFAKGINPSFAETVDNFYYLVDAEKTKDPLWKRAGRKIPFAGRLISPKEPGYNATMLADGTRTLQNAVGNAFAEINKLRKAEAAKYVNSNPERAKEYAELTSDITKMPDVELIKYFDKLTKTQPLSITDENGNIVGNYDYWQFIEKAFAEGTAMAFPEATIRNMVRPTSAESPSDNYYDMNSSSVQTKQLTFVRDFCIKRQKEMEARRQGKAYSYYGYSVGSTAELNEKIAKKEAKKKEAEEKEKARKATFAFTASVNNIID